MKQETRFMKRSLALLLVAVMVLSNLSGLTLPARAAGDSEKLTYGEIVAGNYDLSAEEKALLESKLLVGESITFNAPTDSGLISVDNEEKTITVATYTDDEGKKWVPTAAAIYVGDEKKENVTLTDGVGYYTYGENAFSVKVTYTLTTKISANMQQTLLGAGAALKNGLSNMKAAYDGTDANLGTVVLAMDILGQLADGISLGWASAQFKEDAIAAVEALEAEIAANNGQLALQVWNAAYAASSSKVQFLVENGTDYMSVILSTYQNLNAIKNDELMNNSLLDSYLESQQPADYTAWKTLKNNLGKCVAALEIAANGDWSALDAQLVADGLTPADYAKLDTLVAALGEQTAVTVKESLIVATAEVKLNMSMFNVTVNVVLETVQNNVVKEYATKSDVLTLAEGATDAEILAEIAAKDIENSAKAEWAGVYVEEHFEATNSVLPATLTEDITYTITYSPKEYQITTNYGDDMTVPYGYKYTLPIHADLEKAYDYTVNGNEYAQGKVITIEGDTEITRTAGKAYASYDLYSVVADNFGNALAQQILKSGALKDNVTINVRKPDPTDVANLLKLYEGLLTAEDYDAAYADLSWVPYTYGATGTENLFSGSSASWSEKEAKVQYILYLSNFSVEEVQAILDLATQLKEEASAQQSAMDSLASMESTLVQLDKAKLGALNGVIDVTDFTEGDGTDTDAENLEIREEMKAIVSAIINNNLGSNSLLKIYNMVVEYNTDGLRYYYENYAEIKAEVNSLSGYLSNLMDNEEALRIMCNTAGYGEYADKIADVETKLNEYNARLSAPNDMIDLSSPNLGKLIAALTADGDVVCETADCAYLLSDILTALDQTPGKAQVNVQVIVSTPNGNKTITTSAMDAGTALTQGVVDTLKQDVENAVAALIGNVAYYNLTIEGTAIENLVGTVVDANVNIYYTYTAKSYTVMINGEEHENISINDLEINLPKHTVNGYRYEYTIDGVSGVTASTYTFTLEQIDRLFTSGSYTITRTEINEDNEKLETSFEDWLVKDGEGNVIGMNAAIDSNKDGIMGFAMTLINSGYTYIELGGESLLYFNEEDTLEISLQTLINAMLNDEQFGSETLIALGKNGEGKLLTTTLSLGNSAEEIIYQDLEFILYLNSVPSQMVTVANGLETIKPYMSFKTNNGALDIIVDLPEKVYEAYLASMLATGHVTKDDICGDLNDEIALQFFWDYIDLIVNTDADTTTFTNTLAQLGISKDLTGYEKYYQMLKKGLKYNGLAINPEADGVFDIAINAESQKAINSLVNLLGFDISSFETYLGMVKEYKDEEAVISMSANIMIAEIPTEFDAVVIDANAVKAEGLTNKANALDFTNNVADRVAAITGKGAVMLLDNVGDLVFNGEQIVLDLNGYSVNSITVKAGTVYIVDSKMDTLNAGSVGSVTGNVVIFAGNYADDVTAFLKDGYVQVDGNVQNVLYTMSNVEGNITVNVNTDFLASGVPSYTQFAKAVSVDLAVDMLLNYYTAAALTIDGNEIYNVNLDDIIGLLGSDSKADDLVEKLLNTVSVPGMSNFVNVVLEDMLAFAEIEAAAKGDGVFATYNMTTAPWMLTVEHVTDGDYITFGIVSNSELSKSFNMSLMLSGSNVKFVEDLARELAAIVEEGSITIDVSQPTFDAAKNEFEVAGNAAANFVIDLSSAEYQTIIAVIMDYTKGGNAWTSALEDQRELKALVDATSVADIIAALKALNRTTSFTEMAEAVGYNASAEIAELEDVYHLVLCAAGKALETLDVTGMASTLGNLDKDGDGVYELNESATRNPSAEAKGYSVYTELSASVSLSVKLFGEVDDACEHDWEDATCTEPKTCKLCGETEGSALGHSFTDYISNGDATCTEDGTKTAECDRGCGETKTVVDEGSALGHNYVNGKCTRCDKEDPNYNPGVPHTHTPKTIPAVDPTCTETGLTEGKKCATCGEILLPQEIVPALGHSFTNYVSDGNATCTEDGTKTAKCDRCDATDTVVDEDTALGHTQEEMPGKDATCTEYGISSGMKCSVCGEILMAQEFIPALGHTEVVDAAVAATCTETGLTEGKHCSVCGEVLVAQEEVAALGHSFGQWTVTKAATCTEDGEETRTCACGETETRVIEATGHSFGQWTVTKAATCTEDGEETRTCACGETETRVIEATGEHTYGEWEVTKEATKKEEGEETRTCSLCGHTETRPIDKLESSFPWWIILVVLLGGGGAGVGGYFLLKKRKLF